MSAVMENTEAELMTLKGVVRRYLKALKSKDLPYEERIQLKGALVEMLEDLSRE